MSGNIGFVVAYHHPENKNKFDKRYQKHLEVFEGAVGDFVESAEVLKVEDGTYYQIASVMLKSGTDFADFMNSPGMKVVVEDVLDFVPEDKFQVFPITETLYKA